MTGQIHPTKMATLEAAVGVFTQKGFSGATTKEIAQAAGVAEGTIFRHFSSKVEILYRIVEGIIPLIGVESLKTVIKKCEGLGIRDSVRHIVENRFQLMRDSKPFVRLILIESNYDPRLRQIYCDQVYRPIHQLLRDFFADGIARNDFREIDPDLAANIIVSFVLYEAIAQEFIELNPVYGQSFTVEGVTDVLLDGIIKRS